MLDINSEILFKFYWCSILRFSKICIRVVVLLKFVLVKTQVDGYTVCMYTFTLILRTSMPQKSNIFSCKFSYFRLTTEFFRKCKRLCFFSQNAFFHHKNLKVVVLFSLNCSSFSLQLNAENRFKIRADTRFQ